MVCRHPRPSPATFVIVRHVMLVFSLIATTICIVVVKRSSSVTRLYANLLVLLLIGSCLADVFLQLILDPVFLLPVVCIYRNAPMLNIPMSAAAATGGFLSLLALCVPVYFALFLYRHQAIIPTSSRLKLPKWARVVLLAVLCVPYGAIGIAFYLAKAEPSQMTRFNERFADEWDPAIISRLDCFLITVRDAMPVSAYVYYVLVVFVPLFGAFFIFAVARHTFLILRKVRNLSQKMQHLHRILTRALIVQSLIPVVVVLLPFYVACTIDFYFGIYRPEAMNAWAADPIDGAILIISFHGTAHALALMLITPAFRMQLLKMCACRVDYHTSPRDRLSSAFTDSKII